MPCAQSLFHVKHDASPARVDVSRETAERLTEFERLLRQWNRTVNLVSSADLAQIWPRHISDSLQLLPLLPKAGPFVDIGTGAGFPGLILAIAGAHPFHLVEADRRKAAFLREAARYCEAPVTIHAERAESVVLPPARVITARALAPLSGLLALVAPHLATDGICLFLKGAAAQTELQAAHKAWDMTVKQWPSRTAASAVILQIGGLKRHADHRP